MAEVIRMPRMSDTMEEGNIVEWLKQEGDEVEPGDTLAEVETDKATMELDSYSEGVLLHIAVKSGAVPINGVIAVIGEKGEDWQAAIAATESNGSAQPKEASTPTETAAPESAAPAVETTAATPSSSPSTSDTRIKASPLAKSMAADAGIDIGQITGSGDNGRIIKRDIEAYLQTQGTSATPAAAPTPAAQTPAVQPFTHSMGGDNFENVPLTQMRKVIARRLGESKFSAPHFYLTMEIDMSKTIQSRKQINEIAPVKISFNDLIVKACAAALRQHPAINSSWMGDKIRKNGNINIGVAVAVNEGLLVPVIQHADMKSLSQISTETRALAGKARERKLQPNEMSGNTFTISNLGMFDIDEFTAIINPPDACILAVGSIAEKPIVKDGELTIGNIMKVTMSCDHRVVDGASGARFLQTLKEMLEDPIRILV